VVGDREYWSLTQHANKEEPSLEEGRGSWVVLFKNTNFVTLGTTNTHKRHVYFKMKILVVCLFSIFYGFYNRRMQYVFLYLRRIVKHLLFWSGA
jgi:hypothetical protein